jgi:queuine/archaeosine tRNA-ribosyltransferase
VALYDFKEYVNKSKKIETSDTSLNIQKDLYQQLIIEIDAVVDFLKNKKDMT